MSNEAGEGAVKAARKFKALNPPVHRASTLVFDSTAEFFARRLQLFDGYSYGLYGTPTTRELEEQVARIEGGQRSVVVPSGLASLTHPLLAMLDRGDKVLVADCVYGPLRTFCDTTLRRLGIAVEYFAADADSVAGMLDATTRLVLLESPGSYAMEIQEIAVVCAEAHAAGAKVLIDNTWGFGQSQMFDHGVDIVCTALSKYAAGHSDVCMGAITVTDDDLFRTMKAFVAGMGSGVSSDDAYLVMRGLSTLELRLQEHGRRGLALSRWLRAQPAVRAVLNPADPDDAGHSRFRRYFSGGNGLVGLEVVPNTLAAISDMLDGLRHFHIGASWGGTTSLAAVADLSTMRSARRLSPGSYVLRLHMGLEALELLFLDLEAGFARLSRHQ